MSRGGSWSHRHIGPFIAIIFAISNAAFAAGVLPAAMPETHRCVFEVPATTYPECKRWVNELRAAGVSVSVVASPSVILGRGTEAALSKARALGIREYREGSQGALAKVPTTAEAALLRQLNQKPFDLGSVEEKITAASVSMERSEPGEEPAVAGLQSTVGTPSIPRLPAQANTYDGFTDFMRGDIALGVIPFESDGTIDPNIFSWTSDELDTVVTRLVDVLDAWSALAPTYTQHVTWYLIVFQPTDPRMQVPWQNHLHMSQQASYFVFDTLPAKVYDNFGIDTVARLNSNWIYWQGSRWTRAETLNKRLADSVGAQVGIHHFVGHARSLCGLPPSSGWWGTGVPGRATFYPFRRSEPYSPDSCNVSWPMPNRTTIAEEALHTFGNRVEEYVCDQSFGDRYEFDGHISRSTGYNTPGCRNDSTFNFKCGMRFSWPDVCLATARMIGWWGADFGDAPPPYPTRKANNGAWHRIAGFEWLGKRTSANGLGSVSFENDADSSSPEFIDRDGRSNLSAPGGDSYDDGVFFSGVLNRGTRDTLEVIMSNHGVGDKRYLNRDTTRIYLNAWIDWNGDKDWDDIGEHFIDSYSWVPTSPSDLSDTVIFTFTPPSNYADTIWARFRLDYGEDCGRYSMIYSDPALSGPRGPALWGEVEDYKIVRGLPENWLRADLDGNHWIDVIDEVILEDYTFSNGPAPVPLEAADLNCDAVVDVFDILDMINYLYNNIPVPCQP